MLGEGWPRWGGTVETGGGGGGVCVLTGENTSMRRARRKAREDDWREGIQVRRPASALWPVRGRMHLCPTLSRFRGMRPGGCWGAAGGCWGLLREGFEMMAFFG